MPSGSSDDGEEWIDDEDVAMQLNAYAAIASEFEEDTLGEKYAEAVQLAYAATNILSHARGKSKGKGKDTGKLAGKVN